MRALSLSLALALVSAPLCAADGSSQVLAPGEVRVGLGFRPPRFAPIPFSAHIIVSLGVFHPFLLPTVLTLIRSLP